MTDLEKIMVELWSKAKPPELMYVERNAYVAYLRVVEEEEKARRICSPAGLAEIFPSLVKK
jgi:hypothetical protein